RHKDPALSPLLQGFAQLDSTTRSLTRWNSAGALGQRRTLRRLRRISQRLNVVAWSEVLGLLDRLRCLSLDRGLLEEMFLVTLREPALRNLEVAPLHWEASLELPVSLPIPRSHFEDILRNLLRNAIEAQARAGITPISVG